MIRKIIPYSFQIDDSLRPEGSLEDWLCKQATTESWMLAHAADGVIWGYVNSNQIITSHDVARHLSPPLRLETLQQLRLFNAASEVRLWRSDKDDWHAIRIIDVADPSSVAIDENQLLWGTFAEPIDAGFVRLEDGAQGLVHIIPLFDESNQLNGELGMPSDKSLTRVYLKVRHYLSEDALGVNTISMSRLMDLGVEHYA